MHVVSNASCTTNCLAPPVSVSGVSLRSKDDSAYTLVQFTDNLCTGPYHCLDLTLDSMTMKKLPEGHAPAVLCDKLETDPDEEGAFNVLSCPGSLQNGCSKGCDECKEDFVQKFSVDVCKE